MLILVMVAAGAGAAWVVSADDPPPPLLTQTGAALGAVGDRSLERVADAWLSVAARDKAGGDVRGRGAALEAAIRIGRADALRAGAAPVPAEFKRRFAGDFPPAVLDEARWLVAAPNSRLGRVLARWPVEEGAVTLGEVIVFKTAGASRSAQLFAHELAHVEQYRKLGIGEFARRYAADPGPLEEEARAKARRVT